MTILIVDYNEVDLTLLEEMLKVQGYKIYAFSNPFEAVESIETNQYDLAFIDYMIPEMNGIEIVRKIKEKNKNIICLMMIQPNNNSIKLDALEVGVDEFLSKPIETAEIIASIKNNEKIIKLNKLVNKDHAFEKNNEYEILSLLSNITEYKDYKHFHTKRVGFYSKLIAKKAGLDEEFQDLLLYSAPLHDIGKIAIPDTILLKSEPLTNEEFEIMKTHTIIGFEMLKNFNNKYLKAASEIAYIHHEKFDGTGYPNGLKGDEIDIKAQIVAIADVFDALISIRPYRKSWSFQNAFEFIEENLRIHFNPFFGRVFLDNKDEVVKIYNKYKD
jgi:response regulator RpfG family c-di-GMP phosphodiesterase